MPDAGGNFRGISVPELPWRETAHAGQRAGKTAAMFTERLDLAIESIAEGAGCGCCGDSGQFNRGIAAVRAIVAELVAE